MNVSEIFETLDYGPANSDSELGIDVGLFGEYLYSEDLTFEFGYTHLFPGDGLENGNFRWRER